MIEGFHYGAGPIPPDVIKQAGRSFVLRYLVPDKWTQIFQPEYQELVNAGLQFVGIYEKTASRSLDGFDAGASDMNEAMNYARSIGGPPNGTIYIAADDFGATTDAEFVKIKSYVDGAVSVRGKELTGAYGGYNAIKYLADRDSCKYYWQTFAWSAGKWDSRANLQQYKGNVALGPYKVDYDRAMTVDFGQWGKKPCDDPWLELFGEVGC